MYKRSAHYPARQSITAIARMPSRHCDAARCSLARRDRYGAGDEDRSRIRPPDRKGLARRSDGYTLGQLTLSLPAGVVASRDDGRVAARSSRTGSRLIPQAHRERTHSASGGATRKCMRLSAPSPPHLPRRPLSNSRYVIYRIARGGYGRVAPTESRGVVSFVTKTHTDTDVDVDVDASLSRPSGTIVDRTTQQKVGRESLPRAKESARIGDVEGSVSPLSLDIVSRGREAASS